MDRLDERAKALMLCHGLIGSTKRSKVLIAKFPNGPGHRDGTNFAQGWAFAIGPWFYDALDIKFASGGWTQGSAFNFRTGHTIYDLPKAYEAWAEYLKEATVFLQVEDARPVIPATKDGMRFPGFARVSIHVPTEDKKKSLTLRTQDFTQDELVLTLIKGLESSLLEGK